MLLQLQVESDMFILAPFMLVFVQGMTKLMNLVLLEAWPLVIFVECATWACGSNLELMSSSPKWQQHQNAMHATAKTAMSNVSERLR